MEKDNVRELNKNRDEVNNWFAKEISELNKMIKEELGESKGYYRITLILELIEKDIEELVKTAYEFADLSNAIKQLNIDTDKTLKIKEDLINNKIMPDFDRVTDPLSQIVKDVNTLNDDAKKHLMYYISGYASGHNKNKK